MPGRRAWDEVLIVNPHDPSRDPRELTSLGSHPLAGPWSIGAYAEPGEMAYYSEYPGSGYAGQPGGLGWYGVTPELGQYGLEPVGYYAAADPLAGYAEYPQMGMGQYPLSGYAEYAPYSGFAEYSPYSGYAEYAPYGGYGQPAPYGGYGEYAPYGGYAEAYPGIAEYPPGAFAEYPAAGYAEYPPGYAEYPPGFAEDPVHGYADYGEYGDYAEEPLHDYAETYADVGAGPEMVGYGADPLNDGMGGYVRDVPSPFTAGCPLPTNVNGLGAAPLEGYQRPRKVSPTVTAYTDADTPMSMPEAFRPLW